ncbi:MAG: hypothetical protein WCJ39_09730 [bacterium]
MELSKDLKEDLTIEDVIKRVDDHAFAYYYAALCHKEMGGKDENNL